MTTRCDICVRGSALKGRPRILRMAIIRAMASIRTRFSRTGIPDQYRFARRPDAARVRDRVMNYRVELGHVDEVDADRATPARDLFRLQRYTNDADADGSHERMGPAVSRQ